MPRQPAYLIGVDIGTQGTKTAIFDELGRTRATAFQKSRLIRPLPGQVQEDPERQTLSVFKTIRDCVDSGGIDSRRVAAIGIAGQMAGVIGIGDDGRHVTPYDSWLDTRCGPYITQMESLAGKEVLRKTGGPVGFNHGPKILWWRHEQPDAYRAIASFVQPGGYAAMRLCGLPSSQAYIDTTYLHFSGFADNRRATWNEQLCRTLDVAREKLPRIVQPAEVIGHVTARAAKRCGVPCGVPVVAGCGDTAASFLACGATREGVCVDVAGTASVFAATTGRFRADMRHGTLACGQSAVSGLWHPYAYINGGGMNLDWFLQKIASDVRAGGRLSFDRLDRQAARIVPRQDDPIFLPHLAGRNSPAQPELRGGWAGLSWHHSAADLYRSLLEAVALEYCIYRDVLAEMDPQMTIREVRVSGGGAKSGLWNTIKADALGIDVVQVARSEGAPLGAALLAGHGVGLLKDIDQAVGRWVTLGRRFLARTEWRTHYNLRSEQYQRLLACLHDWSRKWMRDRS